MFKVVMAKRIRNSIADADADMINLISKDSQVYPVDKTLAIEQSDLIRSLLEGNEDCVSIPLLEVESKCLDFIADYINNGEDKPLPSGDDLFAVVVAANYMNMPTLLDSSCKEVADMIKDKSVEEIRTLFGIESTLTQEEEDAIKRENQWAFSD